MGTTVVIFWFAAVALTYTYVGYAAALWLVSTVRGARHPEQGRPNDLEPLSIILAVRNERRRIEARIADLLDQDYPSDRVEIVVASDGSTDGTDECVEALARQAKTRIRLVSCPALGKAAALNAGVEAATADILVFADARQTFRRDALRQLVHGLADPSVGAVSGYLALDGNAQGTDAGVRTYWQLESWVRQAEARSGSAIGVTGAIYAARRDAFPILPVGTLLDDVYAPMAMLLAGWRVGYVRDAVAFDREASTFREELQRKTRTATGIYQLIRLLPGVLSLRHNPCFFRFVSHKMLRLMSPFFLLALLVTTLSLSGVVYRVMLVGQGLAYGLGVLALLQPRARRWTVVRVTGTFLVMNAAALAACAHWLSGREHVWRRRAQR